MPETQSTLAGHLDAGWKPESVSDTEKLETTVKWQLMQLPAVVYRVLGSLKSPVSSAHLFAPVRVHEEMLVRKQKSASSFNLSVGASERLRAKGQSTEHTRRYIIPPDLRYCQPR